MSNFRTAIFLSALLSFFTSSAAFAQCAISTAPSYPSGCASQYFTSISASGTGVTSTISYSAGGCIGDYFNMFTSQGITAPTGSTVSVSISRVTGYLAYMGVYVDWNNNGIFEPTEMAAPVATLSSGSASAVFNFTIPLRGIVTNTNVHMRVFLGEPPSSGGALSTINPPCGAKWGESIDYYLNSTCTTPAITVAPPSPSVCLGNSTTLTASGAGSTPTYLWSPATSLSATTGAAVIASPAVATTYTVTGFGPGVCEATAVTTVSVTPGITAVVSAGGPASFCAGNNVLLSETVHAGTKYQWYNGTTPIPGATATSFLATPAVTTTYSVLATSALGCTATAGATVTIFATPSAIIVPSGPATVCAPATVVLNAPAGSGYNYRWFNTSGVISGAAMANYTATATDGYTVEITDGGTGCKDTSAAIAVNISTAPVAVVSALRPLTFCYGDSTILRGISGSGYTYQWFNGSAPIPGATNNTYTAKNIGTFDYRLKITNSAGCNDMSPSGAFTVTVHPAPVSVVSASGPLTFCTGDNVILSAPSVGGNTYQWYYGATKAALAPLAGSTAASVIAIHTGYYYVRAATVFGCASFDSAVLVTEVSSPIITHNTPLTICKGASTTLLSGVSAAATGITYQWKLNGTNITGADSNTLDASVAGSYTCVINVSGSCTRTTPFVLVKINPLPNPVIAYSAGTLKTGTFYKGYQWYQNLVLINGDTSYKMTPKVNGNYSVIVTDSNLCVSLATTYPLHSLATAELSIVATPVIYPNPATSKVFINYPQTISVAITGMDGKLMMVRADVKEVDIHDLAASTYIIAVYDEAGHKLLAQQLIKN